MKKEKEEANKLLVGIAITYMIEHLTWLICLWLAQKENHWKCHGSYYQKGNVRLGKEKGVSGERVIRIGNGARVVWRPFQKVIMVNTSLLEIHTELLSNL